jgi:hypothetical protein
MKIENENENAILRHVCDNTGGQKERKKEKVQQNHEKNACAMSINVQCGEGRGASKCSTGCFGRISCSCLRVSMAGFSDNTSTSLPPNITAPSHEPFNSSSGGVQCRTNVKVEDRFTVRLGGCGVVIDHVTNFLRTGWRATLHEPVMTVEGRTCPGKERKSC